MQGILLSNRPGFLDRGSTKTTLTLATEATYDWQADQWSIPVVLVANQMLKIGDQPLQIGAGVRYWADSPANGPEG